MQLIDEVNERLKNETYHDRYDCFFELINSLDIDFLDNLIELMQERFNLSKNDNYFACYNPTDEYKVNDDLNIIYIKELVKENEVYKFISTYTYTDYDRILNLADLMASENGVISPEKRIIDIEKRRKMIGNQRKFFIKELCETIYWYLKKINIPDELISLNDFESLSNLLYKSIYSKEDIIRFTKK